MTTSVCQLKPRSEIVGAKINQFAPAEERSGHVEEGRKQPSGDLGSRYLGRREHNYQANRKALVAAPNLKAPIESEKWDCRGKRLEVAA